jgi:hypothetical protein
VILCKTMWWRRLAGDVLRVSLVWWRRLAGDVLSVSPVWWRRLAGDVLRVSPVWWRRLAGHKLRHQPCGKAGERMPDTGGCRRLGSVYQPSRLSKNLAWSGLSDNNQSSRREPNLFPVTYYLNPNFSKLHHSCTHLIISSAITCGLAMLYLELSW